MVTVHTKKSVFSGNCMSELIHSGWIHENPLDAIHSRKKDKFDSHSSMIDLSMINPDIAPPRLLLDRLVEATLKSGNHRYAVARGVRKLREAFAYKYLQHFQVNLEPGTEICVTMGSKDAILQSLRLLAPVGSRVLLSSPSYSAHVSACHLAGLEPVFFALSRDEDLMLARLEQALQELRPRILLLNFPNNPTGIVVSQQFWVRVSQLLAEFRCVLINDFVYGELGYQGSQPVSALTAFEDKKNALEVYSLSKAYSIPGWRVAAMVGDRSVIGDLSKLKSQVDYGIFLPMQIAASCALQSPEDLTDGIRRSYEARALCLAQGLRRLGFDFSMPSAGACLWVKLPEVSWMRSASLEEDKGRIFSERLFDTHGVQVLPGSVFGADFRNFLRFALVRPENDLQQVILALDDTLRSHA
jgi:alanine-synthesizing transaminase